MLREAKALIVASGDPTPAGTTGEFERRPEAVMPVLEGALSVVKRENSQAIVRRIHGCMCLGEHRARLIDAPGCYTVVEEAGEVPCTGRLWDTRKQQRRPSGGDPGIGRDREHAGDTQTNLRLLFRRKNPA